MYTYIQVGSTSWTPSGSCGSRRRAPSRNTNTTNDTKGINTNPYDT